MTCKWLPELLESPDWNNYKEYEDYIYTIFRSELLSERLYFKDKKIQYRRKPIEYGKEEIFYHCTCKNYTTDNRSPDSDRIIRIKWIKAFIINYICYYDCCNQKPMYWVELNGKKCKHYIYFRRYVVILEERDNYFLLITGFYVVEEYYHRRMLKKFEKYNSQKTPL